MKIKFASDLIKIIFEEDEPFFKKTIIMRGEALWNGFDADLSTMQWLDLKRNVENTDKTKIQELITKNNTTQPFKIKFMEE